MGGIADDSTVSAAIGIFAVEAPSEWWTGREEGSMSCGVRKQFLVGLNPSIIPNARHTRSCGTLFHYDQGP